MSGHRMGRCPGESSFSPRQSKNKAGSVREVVTISGADRNGTLTRTSNYFAARLLFLRQWKVYVLSECKSGTSSYPERRTDMSDWIHGLPLGWMAILIFGATFLSAAVILLVVH